MRKILLLVLVYMSTNYDISAQNLSYTCPRTVTVSCGPPCITLNAKFPDLRALADDYTLTNATVAVPCYPIIDPGAPGTSTNLTIDDRYSAVLPIGFTFPFYGINYTSLVVSTNGYLSFDISKTGAFSHYGILNSGGSLSASTGAPQDVPSPLYDKSLIMGPYHDLDPSVGTPGSYQIKYDVVGTAPTRKWVLSFYHVPLFLTSCNSLNQNTHQIALNESSGVIEVTVESKQICNGWNQGRGMIGLQDDTRTKGIMPPGRAASSAPWGTIGMNETWRFIPKNGAALYRSVVLLDATGATVATGDTSRVDINTLQWNFTNVCPPPNVTTLYVVKTTYEKIDNSGTFYSLDTINVLRQNSLAASITQSPTTCGASVGSVTVTPSSGTGPYSYTLNGGAAVSAPGPYTFTNLAAGPYTVVVTDATGCTNTLNITVATNNSIPGTPTSTATSCPLSGDGTITVTPGGGTAPFQFSLDGGAPQASGTFTGVGAGIHTVTFTDSGGCSGTVSVTVAAGNTPLTGSVTPTATSCPGVNNGKITVNPTSGTPPYQYSLDGGAFQASNIFNNVSAGAHTVTVKDSYGCTGSFPVTVAAGPALTASVTPTATSCPAVANGTITVNPTNGTAPYQYSLDGGAFQLGNVFSNVAAGPHSVTEKDANGCTTTYSVTVAAGPALTATVTSTSTTCSVLSDGTITATPNNGTSPYQFSLDGGAFQSSGLFTNVSAGMHNVTVKDANNCTSNFSVNVPAGSSLSSTITSTNPVCANLFNGTITLNPTSGVLPYQYSINGGAPQASNTFTGLAPGFYTINFTDVNGCTGINATTLLSNPAITATPTLVTPLCNGSATGSISVNAVGGVPPYQYSSDGGVTYQASPTFSGLMAGTYTFRVKDAAGCLYDFTFTLTQPPALTVSSDSTAATCPNNDGSITISAGGGTPAYAYSIDGGANYSPANIFTGVSIGIYSVVVKDANGCMASMIKTVPLNDTMRLELGPDSTICFGSSVVLMPQTNDLTDTFRWRPPAGLNYDTIKNPIAKPNDTTKYILLAKWGVCQREDSVTINILHKPVALAGNDTTICTNSFAILNGSAANLSGPVTYAWTPAASVIPPNLPIAVAHPDSTQQYVLTVKDSYGCNFTVTDSMWVFIEPPVPAFAGNDTNALLDKPHHLKATGGVSYSWTPAGPLNNPNIANPIAILHNDTYFRVWVTDAIGCRAFADVFIKVYEGPTYYLPNAFTPNGDGLNDKFFPVPVGMKSTDYFMVYNRFGELVYQTRVWMQGWDGTFKGKPANQDSYVWIIRGHDENGILMELKGTVTLIR